MATFRILTFVTDDVQYLRMLKTFDDAGFREQNTVFAAIDNTKRDNHDPYSVLNHTLRTMTERFLVVCHQDVRLDRGAGYDDLLRALDSAGEHWGVAGPAGITLDYRQVLSISDPWDAPLWSGPWPIQVQALDELLLVIRPGRACLSDGLSGFHLYALDLCLATRRRGWDAIAINFPLTHLSDGTEGQSSAAYSAARIALQQKLSPLYVYKLAVVSTGESVLLTRFGLLRKLADRPRVHEAIKRRVRGRADRRRQPLVSRL